MSKSIVVQFFPDGTVAHTRDKDFDLAETLGAKRSIQRMTDIKFSEYSQMFYIEFLRGHMLDGRNLVNHVVARDAKGGYIIGIFNTVAPALFNTYEEAVAAEIEVVNQLRLLGCKFS